MKATNKLMFLEFVSGILGWGWLIAGAATLYFVVVAVGFGGSWADAGIAFAVSAVCKWLAKGFRDTKVRVAFEAKMVAKGMSKEDAGKAWAAAYTGPGEPALSSATPQAPVMTEENRRKAEKRSEILSEYGEYLESHPTACEIRDSKFLPHDKQAILEAIYLEIVRETDATRLEALKTCALMLADFQEGVGEQPLSPLGIDLTELTPADREDAKALAKRIVAGNSGRERYESFSPRVEEDRANILAKLTAAEQMREHLPKDKIREVLG